MVGNTGWLAPPLLGFVDIICWGFYWGLVVSRIGAIVVGPALLCVGINRWFWFLVSGWFGCCLGSCRFEDVSMCQKRSREKENRKERKKSEDRLSCPLLGRYNTFRVIHFQYFLYFSLVEGSIFIDELKLCCM